MQKLENGGCEGGGDLQDMVRQAIEDVVREQIGGGAEDGGSCPTGGATDTGGSSADKAEGSTTCPAPQPTPDDDSDDAKKARSGNWLVALAQGMSRIAANHLNKMMDAQEKMEKSSPETDKGLSKDDKQKNQNDFVVAQGEFQAESKLFSMSIEATSTAVKAIGDGLSSLARKQ
jgi:hypothetical protein